MAAKSQLAPDTLECAHQASTDTITGVLMKTAGMRTRAIQGAHPINSARCRFIGPAYTVRYVPIREDCADSACPVSPGSRLHGRPGEVAAGSVVALGVATTNTLRRRGCSGQAAALQEIL